MCLGIPGRIIEINGPAAKADIAGIRKDVSLKLLDGVSTGDYVIIHAGFAIEKVDPEKAQDALALIKEITRP